MKRVGLSPFQALGNAVVLQSVKDYRAMHRRNKKHPGNVAVRSDMEKIEHFFHSGYFNLFTDLDGPALLLRIQRELEEDG